jgi:hypothetical protein
VLFRANDTHAAVVRPSHPPAAFGSSEPIPDHPADIVPLAAAQGSLPTLAEQLRQSVSRIWVAPLAVAYEELWTPGVMRVGLAQWTTFAPGLFMNLVRAEVVYQWALLALAVAALASIRRTPRLLLALSVPAYVLSVHASTQLTLRYFYPAMPAVVLLAGMGALVMWSAGRAVMTHTGTPVGTPSAPASDKRSSRRSPRKGRKSR